MTLLLMSVMIIIIMIAVMMIVMLMMTMVTVMVVMTSGSVKPRTSQPPPPCPLVLSGTCEPACVGSRLCRTAALCRWRASPSLSLWARHRAVAPPLVHAHLAPQRCPQGSCSLSLKQALQLLCPFSRTESKFGVSARATVWAASRIGSDSVAHRRRLSAPRLLIHARSPGRHQRRGGGT